MLLNRLSLRSGFASRARVTCRHSCIHYLIRERETENKQCMGHRRRCRRWVAGAEPTGGIRRALGKHMGTNVGNCQRPRWTRLTVSGETGTSDSGGYGARPAGSRPSSGAACPWGPWGPVQRAHTSTSFPGPGTRYRGNSGVAPSCGIFYQKQSLRILVPA